MEVRRLTNLARLAAALVAGRGLAVTALKAADFAGGGAAMAPREVLFWRVFFQHLLAGAWEQHLGQAGGPLGWCTLCMPRALYRCTCTLRALNLIN